MCGNQLVQRAQRKRARPHLVGQRREAELHTLAGVAFALAVQRLMLSVLLIDDGGEQIRTRPAPWGRVVRRRRLGELLALAAGELLAHRLNHLPLARNHLQRLRHVLAHLRQPLRPAACARGGRSDHHTLARQVLGEGLARRPAPLEPLDLGRTPRRRLGREIVFGGARGEFVELELQLSEQPFLALRAPSVERAPQLLDHQLQRGDLDLRIRDLGLGRSQGRAQPLDLCSGTVGAVLSLGGGAAVHSPQGKAIRTAPVIECFDGPINAAYRPHGIAAQALSSRSRRLATRPTGSVHTAPRGQAIPSLEPTLTPPATDARSAPGCANRSPRADSRAGRR